MEKDAAQMISGANQHKDEKWATWSCTLGWPVKGLWGRKNEEEPFAVARSHNTFSRGEYKVLAVADQGNGVKLFRYPCLNSKAKALEGLGHSFKVSNLKWSPNDDFLVTTGGEDQTIMVWKVDKQK